MNFIHKEKLRSTIITLTLYGVRGKTWGNWPPVYLLTLSLSFSEFLAKHKMTAIPHCPSSPALVLCVFSQKDEVVLRGRRLSVVTMIASRLVWCSSLNA
jgi:hypothetical protein